MSNGSFWIMFWTIISIYGCFSSYMSYKSKQIEVETNKKIAEIKAETDKKLYETLASYAKALREIK